MLVLCFFTIIIQLHVAEMSHCTLIQLRGGQRILDHQVLEGVPFEFGHNCGLLTENIALPLLVEQELFDT